MMKEWTYRICALFFVLIVGPPFTAFAAESEWKNAVEAVKTAVVNVAGESFDRKTKFHGCGFIVDKSGYIVTTYHVIKSAATLLVTLYDGRVFNANILGADPMTDIAVIRINTGGNLPVMKLGDSESLDLSEKVVAFGYRSEQEHMLTTGIVSMRKVSISDIAFIQTDAEINAENSGGPLINMRGEAVGINTAIIEDKTGKGYAVPINTVRYVMNELIAKGRVERGWLGVQIQPLTPELARTLGLAHAEGVMISDITKGSPAESAGMKKGDIILELNRMAMSDASALRSMITSLKPGDNAMFLVFRDGRQKMYISVKLGKMPVVEATKGMSPIVSEKPFPTTKSDVDELPQVKTKPNKNAYAVVIGIEQYRQKLPKADFAAHDAKIISEYLTKTMGYPEENVITLINDRALKSDMEKYFDRWLSNNVEENGRVFIYYSGHGAPNIKNGDAYLVPYDGDPTFIAETGYPMARLYESLGKLKAKEIIVVLDSCFSGGGGRSVLAKGAKPLVITINAPNIQNNIAVMTASTGDQISSAYEEKGHGLFTYFLLKGIKTEDVVKTDGSIKMDDLFGYIKPQVERIARKQYNNEQTPQLIGAKRY